MATSLADGNSNFGPTDTQQTIPRQPRTQTGWIAGASLGKDPFTERLNYPRVPVDSSVEGTLTVGGTRQRAPWVPSGISGD